MDNSDNHQVVPGISVTSSGQATVDPSLTDVLFDLAIKLEKPTNLPVDVQHVLAAIMLAARKKELDPNNPLSCDDPALVEVLVDHVKTVFEQFGGKAGLLDMQAGRSEAACRHWQQCLNYAPNEVDNVLASAESWLDFTSIVSEVLPQSPTFLLDLTQRRFRADADEERRNILMQQAEELIDERDLPEADRASLRGRMFGINGDVTRAIREYLDAVQQQPNNAAWRFQLGQLLLTKGLVNAARKQLEACTRLEPDNSGYRRSLEQIMQKLSRENR